MMSACMCMTSCDDPNPSESDKPSSPEWENILAFNIVDGEAEVRCVSDTVAEVKIPSEVTIDGATYPVTTIAQEGFSNLPKLKALYIPVSINKIKREAFKETDIESLYIESLESWCDISLDYDYYYDSVERRLVNSHSPIRFNTTLYVKGVPVYDLVIPGTVKDISDGSFYGLNCRSVTFPKGVESIGVASFGGCENLTEIRFPDSLREIKLSAFENCKKLSEVDFGNGVKSIFLHAFKGCEKLVSVTLPESLTYVGVNSFDFNTKEYHIKDADWWCQLKRPEWFVLVGGAPLFSMYPDNEDEYPHSLYIGGKEVTDIVIPGSLSKITADTFRGNTALRSVTIGEGITDVGKNAFRNCPGLKDVTFPSTLRTMGWQAFQDSGIEDLHIPPCGLDSIPQWAFYGCTRLKSIEITEPVSYIGMMAFADCVSLTKIVLPKTLSGSEGVIVLDGCICLNEIYVQALTPPNLDFGLPDNLYDNIKVYIPSGTLDAYKESLKWSRFKLFIETDIDNDKSF